MHWRKGTWALVIFSVLMLIWLIAGIASAAGNPTGCGISPRC
jgi:short subunit fatty acids transporter